MKKKKLAIIGSGPSGILTAKHALMENYDIYIFEKKENLGGIWSSQGFAWPDLSTNASKFTMTFPFFQWLNTDDLFPSKKSVLSFFNEITTVYNIKKYILFETTVELITQNVDNSFTLTYTDKYNKKFQENFDKVIIAVGKLCKMDFVGFEKYRNNNLGCKINIIHSGEYKYPENFKNKKVVVLGQGHSSTQISSEISKYTSDLINLFRKSHGILPLTVFSKKYNKFIPTDMFSLYSRKIRKEIENFTQKEKFKYRKKIFFELLNQNHIHPDLFIEENPEIGVPISICNGYLDNVKNGKIKIIKSKIKEIQEKTILLENGMKIEDVDDLILGTGYLDDISFFDQKLLKILDYNPYRKKRPIDLNLSYIYNRKIKNLAFVGSLPNQVLLQTIDMQALVALQYLKNQDNYDLFEKRILHNNFPFDYNDMAGYIELLAKEIGWAPDLEFIRGKDKELYECMWDGPYMYQHYFIREEFYGTEIWKRNENFIKEFNRDLKEGRQIKYNEIKDGSIVFPKL